MQHIGKTNVPTRNIDQMVELVYQCGSIKLSIILSDNEPMMMIYDMIAPNIPTAILNNDKWFLLGGQIIAIVLCVYPMIRMSKVHHRQT